MINSKTFYQVLGVLNSAEDVVIRAAYRSLSNKYHPDKWTGDKTVAHERMLEINAAYDTLDDDTKRQKYDDELRKQGRYDDAADIDDDNKEFDGIYSEHNDAWDIAIQVYPELNSLHEQLKRINSSLAYTFKTLLVERKDFDKGAELATQLERAFLSKYFGNNEDIVGFAKSLIANNYRAAARELNRIVSVMGANVDSVRVKQVIRKKHPEAVFMKGDHQPVGHSHKAYTPEEQAKLAKRNNIAVAVIIILFVALLTWAFYSLRY